MQSLPNLKLPLLLIALITGLMFVLWSSAWAANLLQNDGLEPPFVKYGEWTGGGRTFDLEVAHNWQRFYIPAGTPDNGNRLRYFRASAVEFLFGSVEKRDGTDAQLYWSTSPFDAGIYQQVSGVTIGEYYGFQAGILQVYGNTTTKIHNKMFRSVGIDPFGGTDPAGANVIWGPEEGLDADWFYPGVGAQAQSTTITVFVRVRSIDDAPPLEENVVWVDDTFLDIAPTTTLTLTIDSPTQVTASWNGTPRSGFHLFAYEAQYRKASESTWTNLQVFDSSTSPIPTATSASFTVEPGQQYVVRARTWHEQNGGDLHEVPSPWAEQTITVGGIVAGKVLDNQGKPFLGSVTVTAGGALTTSSAADGSYALHTGAGTFDITATHPTGWNTPQPVRVTVPDLQTVTPLTLTLRPPDNIIQNGDFETGPAGWQVTGTSPTTITVGHRSGAASLSLSGTVTLTQTGYITGSYRPVLSFWYKVNNGDGNDLFIVDMLGTGLSTASSFSTSTVGDWQHAWLSLDSGDVYTGPTGVRITLEQRGGTDTTVWLDEVSLGSSQIVYSTYLPVILK
ncbi:MAG: hypothetical protein D6784_15905 [Chloroflexi bacterium]|nr:MAG: hypothetical protein D6784_15905 [Chloroflexota bacterium]